MHVDLDDGRASLRVRNLEVEDYGNLVNALQDGPSVPAHVSFECEWRGVKERLKLSDQANHFAGNFIRDHATLHWSARESGFSFAPDPLASGFAVIGHERNGVFFP